MSKIQYTGEIFSDPLKDMTRKYITEYFSNPVMTKVKNINSYTMYVVKIHAVLGIEHRYIMVFISKNENEIGSKKSLGELNWISLQTRTLTDEHKVETHSYNPTRYPPLNKNISLIEKNERQYLYSVESFPLSVVLIPKSKKEQEYNDKGNLIMALETYQTILTFV